MRLNPKNHILGKITNDVFLKKYWQKKPLLIRGAIKNFKSLYLVVIDDINMPNPKPKMPIKNISNGKSTIAF